MPSICSVQPTTNCTAPATAALAVLAYSQQYQASNETLAVAVGSSLGSSPGSSSGSWRSVAAAVRFSTQAEHLTAPHRLVALQQCYCITGPYGQSQSHSQKGYRPFSCSKA